MKIYITLSKKEFEALRGISLNFDSVKMHCEDGDDWVLVIESKEIAIDGAKEVVGNNEGSYYIE